MPRLALLGVALLGLAGCTIDVSGDATGLFDELAQLVANVQDNIDAALADPLNSDPYPVLMGGDSARIFYATNLGDVRLNFRGPTNDIVFPGLVGPSNVYQLEGRQRELLRPLVLAGQLSGLTTDGTYVAYIALPDLDDPNTQRLMIGYTDAIAGDEVVYQVNSDDEYIWPELLIADGRVVFWVIQVEPWVATLHVVTLADGDTGVRFINANDAGDAALEGTRLAQVLSNDDGTLRVVLRDIVAGTEETIAPSIASAGGVAVCLSNNRVVWGAADTYGQYSRIVAYDLTTQQTTTLADAAIGTLAGATDTQFVTEAYRSNVLGVERIEIRRYDADGKSKEIADFRADGLAGQTCVLGDRIVYVNAKRQIVTVPFSGGDGHSYAPY